MDTVDGDGGTATWMYSMSHNSTLKNGLKDNFALYILPEKKCDVKILTGT